MATLISPLTRNEPQTPLRKLLAINWLIVLVIAGIGAIGCAMLYSVADGAWRPWALTHAIRIGAAFGIFFIVALIDIRRWFQFAFPIYLIALLLLIAVEFVGSTGGGGQRWLDLKFMRLQPSELMKVSLIL
ncbi:MAG: FtsW/RodA/SpoVE family cell cycle protein, partial [Pseudomonadota bacterium]